MRFIKLGEAEFGTIDDVRNFFRKKLPQRTPPGRFRLTERHARDKVEPGEPLVFVYQARVVFTAFAASAVMVNTDPARERYPAYLAVNLSTLLEADCDLHEVQEQFNNAAGRTVGLVGRSWNRLPDDEHATDLWARLRPTEHVSDQHPAYFAKLCWNTDDWHRPSGDACNVEHPSTYAAQMGFGHEEWLFNFNWLLDGWKYSFLQPVNKSIARLAGHTISVHLFTVGGEKGWFYIGEIRGCQVLTPDQARYARDQFKSRGWLKLMEAQVRAVGGDVRGLREEDPRSLFNIRFQRKNSVLYDEPVPVEASDAIRRIKRYSLASCSSAPKALEEWTTRVATASPRPTGTVYRRGIDSRCFDLEHNALQNELVAWLRKKFGNGAVIVEEDFVDIKVRESHRLILIDLKPDARPRRALREALGQLLEYEFVSAEKGESPTELVVAGPGELSKRELDYLCHLQTKWSLPIRYVCIRPLNGEIEI